ncbi:TPA: sigma 54-interacting transcriptional regulator [Serratia fonticola]|uniref:sigma 54-interacting transcriptional regulator n=1 Tax=Serratia fonticola TaxID=47917 RepID=UPI0021790555|nr:sigma 54-interacting transcriptional regulator [Serratia fonticola]CAI0736357.1 Transcriptional regulatory protein ZraR [Serratia fonticola]CAI1006854.1 Transcriptional regulatory protein ZraR [Serratia fonticola]CAI1007761.1 Transcriptional regulatory protein ZraR [Serratia fonticola]
MQTPNAHILLVEDDISHCTILQALISGWGYRVSVAHNGRQALEQVRAQPFDLILSDVRMAEMDGIAALKAIKSYNPAIPILIMTAYSNVESAVEAIKAGAYDYLTKPLDFDTLQLTLARALEHTSLKSENQDLKQRLRFDQQNFIGRSEPMRKLLEMIAMIAPSDATVLISGESGTGKELIARAVHANSLRKERPLVSINCAALSESLLESELFGHEKGAFTGADKRREGRFMEADQGTLFLDEIGEVSPLMQAKLLRAIQEREIQRVGSNQTLSVDVRLIAATNRDLLADVEAGRFRQDLYYRLNVVTVDSPPLRARREDIPLLAMHFLAKFAERNRKPVKGFTPLAMDMLLKYSWPGNVRELENSVERGVILLSGDFISEKELPLSINQCVDVQPDRQCGQAIQPLEQVEKQAILAALEQTAGNKTEAAKQLGITRKTLLAKLQK